VSLTAPDCDGRAGLICLPKVHTCADVAVLSSGAICGNIDAGPSACDDGGVTCIKDEALNCLAGACVDNDGTAICVADSTVGQPCDLFAGPSCLPATKCVIDAGSSGICTLADPTLCQ
jgi:hypothetical protein